MVRKTSQSSKILSVKGYTIPKKAKKIYVVTRNKKFVIESPYLGVAKKLEEDLQKAKSKKKMTSEPSVKIPKKSIPKQISIPAPQPKIKRAGKPWTAAQRAKYEASIKSRQIAKASKK